MYLEHHGILGQKWGVRRYQNKDGSLTDLGRKRYYRKQYVNDDMTLTDKGRKAFDKAIDNMSKRAGYYRDWDNPEHMTEDEKAAKEFDKTGVIPKGTKAYRTARVEDKLDENRKYVSFTEQGKNDYENQFSEFGLGGWQDKGFDEMRDALRNKGYDTITYKTAKDLKVATTAQVEDFIASQQLDSKSYKSMLQDLRRFENGYHWNPPENKVEKLALEYVRQGHNMVYKANKEALFKTKFDEDNPTFKHFKDLGYDAISDVEDGGLGADIGWAPAIILNPKESLVEIEREHHDW